MSQNRIAKIAGLAVGFSVAFGAFAPMAGAVTASELQAQINALMAQLASLQGGTSVSTGMNFTVDMTVGSTGAQVSALQQMLVGQGHLVMPNGVAYGYFGLLTKAAVMKWQAANGVSATGYFGPISRAKANSMGGATGTVPGTTVGGTGSVSVGVITTPGVEGTLTVSKAASPASGVKLYEGSTRVAVAGIELEAKTSDIKIERIKLDLDNASGGGSDQDFYRKIAQKVYIMDGSTVLASADLSISTVVEDGSDRFITVSGLSYVVPKDSKRVLTVALDARSNWDSALDDDTWTVGVPVEGVRGVDGAGVNQYGPSTAFSNTFETEGELADTATLTISTNSGTVQDSVVIAADGSSENEKDGVELLKFDVRAEKDAVTITDLSVDVVFGGSGTATTSTGYLYDGSTLLDSDSIDTDSSHGAGVAGFTFDDIDYTISRDTTKTLTVKVDIDSANGTATTLTADVDTADVTSENSLGSSITESGSAQGETVTVRNVGLEYTLVSKNIQRIAPAGFAGATSSLQADFVVRVKAVGSAIVFGDNSSTTFPFADNDTLTSFFVYLGGSIVTPAVSSSTSMTVPSGLASAGSNSWTLGEGNTVDIPLTYVMQSRTSAGAEITAGAYAVALERINFRPVNGNNTSDTFMSGNSAWRTSSVVLP
jgi:hypothetical protein